MDVDVPPSIAVGPAQLAKSVNEIADVIGLSSVLKLTGSAAGELLALAGVTHDPADTDLVSLGRKLARTFGAPLTVVTGGDGGVCVRACVCLRVCACVYIGWWDDMPAQVMERPLDRRDTRA